jgi:hypothetical protein
MKSSSSELLFQGIELSVYSPCDAGAPKYVNDQGTGFQEAIDASDRTNRRPERAA